MVNILKIDIYVKVAGLQEPVWNEFQHRMTKEAIKYFVRKQDVKVVHLPKEMEKWTTERLFPDNQIPSKVFFALVETNAFSGNKNKNPYAFFRRWERVGTQYDLEAAIKQKNLQNQVDFLLKEREQEREIRRKEREEQKKESERTRQLLLQLLGQKSQNAEANPVSVNPTASESRPGEKKQTKKNKRTAKGKKTKNLKTKKSKPETDENSDDPDYIVDSDVVETETEGEELSDDEFLSCKGNSKHTSQATCSTRSTLSLEDAGQMEPKLPSITVTGTEVFVQELKLDLLSEPFDEFYFNFMNTWDEAVMEYTRLNMCLGFTNTTRSNSISYEMFARGPYYIVGKWLYKMA
jgi:hypothetical protein